MELEKSKKVEDYLNEIDYKELAKYMPSDFALEMVNFIKLIEGGAPQNKTPVVHYKFIDTILKEGNVVNMCHRGFAKTTVKEYLMWYIAVYGELPVLGRIPYSLYVSDSIELGVKNMRRSMEDRWNRSTFLQQFVPKAKFTDTIWDFTNIEGTRYTVTGHGAQSAIRGTRQNGSRPVLAIVDDVVSDTDAKSPTVINRIEETIYNAILPALDPTNNKIIWSGTPFNASDPLYKAVESNAFNVNVFPVCEKFPCTKEEFSGDWEDRFSYESIKKTYDMLEGTGKLAAFNQEYMLRIMSDEDRLLSDNDIQWYKRDTLLRNRHAYNFYITTDFATGGSKHNDFSVISVWAYNSNGDWFYVDGICKKQLMDANINDLFRLAQEYNPMSVGIEVSGQQGGFIPWIKEEQMKRNVWFTLASENNSGKEGIKPIQKKIERFHLVVPLFKTKKIYFPVELKDTSPVLQAMDELRLVSRERFKSKHDDFSDTISMLIVMKPFKPSNTGNMSKDSSGLWGLDSMGNDDDSGFNSYLV